MAFNWGALLAWTAHSGSLAAPAFLLYGAGIAWTLFYDTVYAHQDIEDDALIGVKSTARLFANRTPIWLMRFLAISTGLMTLACLSTIARNQPFVLATALLGVMGMGMHMLWQLRQLQLTNPLILLMVFRSNRTAGLIPVIFFALALLV